MSKLFNLGLFKNKKRLYSVADGALIPLEEVPDEVFSQKIMGEGVAVKMTKDIVGSPCAGQLTMVFSTLHAFGVKCNNGVEVLVHIGLDTVKLNGRGFTQLAKLNTSVKTGDPIIKIDRAFLKANGYEPLVLVIVTNDMDYPWQYISRGQVKKGISIIAEY